MGRLLFMLLFVCLAPAALGQVECKDVNAPPTDLVNGRLRLPDPASCALVSTSALLRPSEVLEDDLALVPGAGKAGVALLGPGAGDWSLSGMGDEPLASRLEMSEALTPGVNARVMRIGALAPNTAIMLEAPVGRDAGCMVLLADGADDVRLRVWIDGHSRMADAPQTLLVETDSAAIDELIVEAIDPDGRVTQLKGAHDRRTGAVVWTPDTYGVWSLRTIARVTDTTGVTRVRTTQHVVRVTRPVVELAGEVVLSDEDGRIAISVPATGTGVGGTVLVACEVWGVDAHGDEVPVCWAARMQALPAKNGPVVLEMSVDSRWIERAGVTDATTLGVRALRVHSASGTSLLEYEETPVVRTEAALILRPIGDGAIASDVLKSHTGTFVPRAASDRSQRTIAGHVLLLSHGYCSGGMPFEVPHFSGDVEQFNDFDQNRTHDEFALLLEARGRDFKSMGIVAHSQGGCAAAHLYTFYWSALDWATGGRLIQSVGTPYQGTPIAGSAANLGAIFGAGCGENADLSVAGSAVWLSTIPTSTRENIWYWTTSFADGPFFDFCEFATDFLLTDPDDGVIERDRGQLAGANSMGHVEGQCHTDGMRDPPQCRNMPRNTEINAEAAR